MWSLCDKQWFQTTLSPVCTEGAWKDPETMWRHQAFPHIPAMPFQTSTHPSLPLLKNLLRQPSASATQAVFTSPLMQSSGSTSLNSSVTFRTRFPLQQTDTNNIFLTTVMNMKMLQNAHGSETRSGSQVTSAEEQIWSHNHFCFHSKTF